MTKKKDDIKLTQNSRYNKLSSEALNRNGMACDEIHAWLLQVKKDLLANTTIASYVAKQVITFNIVGNMLYIYGKNCKVKEVNGSVITTMQVVANILNSRYFGKTLDGFDKRDFTDLKNQGNLQYRYYTFITPTFNKAISSGYVKTHTDRQIRGLYK